MNCAVSVPVFSDIVVQSQRVDLIINDRLSATLRTSSLLLSCINEMKSRLLVHYADGELRCRNNAHTLNIINFASR